ncbi:MAG: PhoU family transcriptional regulator [Leptospiraceae bacterium]|nr:PhoU family transcriptional regulator [Leptospiraceae bacterium]
MKRLKTRFEYLKHNLNNMAELVLEQVLDLSDSFEQDNYALADEILHRDVKIDHLEKENDNISQSAILDAVASRQAMGLAGQENELLYKNDPLRFALSSIRITRHLERIGDNVVNAAHSWKNQEIPPGFFIENRHFQLMLSRVVTIVGMAVESLVEEKNRFFGSIERVDAELDLHCQNAFKELIKMNSQNALLVADMYRIILSLERMGDLSVNIAEELVRLSTGIDLRHRSKSFKPNTSYLNK